MTDTKHSTSDMATPSPIDEALADVVLHFRLQSADRGQRVARALAHPGFNLDTLSGYLVEPGCNPYGRRIVFQNEHIELIVMNWGSHAASLPHDHGQSEGWVRVLGGSVLHGRYEDEDGELRQVAEQRIDAGTIFHAPRGLVHHMASATARPTVTLHCYYPPIHGMEVFDFAAERAAIVSDDCGAWWPESDNQIVELRNFASMEAEAALADKDSHAA